MGRRECCAPATREVAGCCDVTLVMEDSRLAVPQPVLFASPSGNIVWKQVCEIPCGCTSLGTGLIRSRLTPRQFAGVWSAACLCLYAVWGAALPHTL